GLKVTDFRFSGFLPEFPVEIFSAARVARVVLEPGRIANRVKKQRGAFCNLGTAFDHVYEPAQRKRAFRFIALYRRQNANANRIAAAFRAQINKTRQAVGAARILELTERFADKAWRLLSYRLQRSQEPLNRSPLQAQRPWRN